MWKLLWEKLQTLLLNIQSDVFGEFLDFFSYVNIHVKLSHLTSIFTMSTFGFPGCSLSWMDLIFRLSSMCQAENFSITLVYYERRYNINGYIKTNLVLSDWKILSLGVYNPSKEVNNYPGLRVIDNFTIVQRIADRRALFIGTFQ